MQNGNAVGTVYDASLLQEGAFFIVNVPPGVTTVSASVSTISFRAHDVGVAAATTSTTALRPGF